MKSPELRRPATKQSLKNYKHNLGFLVTRVEMRQVEQKTPDWMNNELFGESAPMRVLFIKLTDFAVTVHVFCSTL